MKKVIITGGSKGIGKKIIEKLLKDKYFVFNISRQEKFFKKKKI
jgi:short-subunit dehydrogenase